MDTLRPATYKFCRDSYTKTQDSCQMPFVFSKTPFLLLRDGYAYAKLRKIFELGHIKSCKFLISLMRLPELFSNHGGKLVITYSGSACQMNHHLLTRDDIKFKP